MREAVTAYEILSGEKKLSGLCQGNQFAVMVGKEIADHPESIEKLIEAFDKHTDNPEKDSRAEILATIGVYAAAHDNVVGFSLGFPILYDGTEDLKLKYLKESYGVAMNALAKHFSCRGLALYEKLFGPLR